MATRDLDPRDLARWSETLAAIARTGLGFTQNLYEKERFEEVLHVAADIKAAAIELEDDAGSSVRPIISCRNGSRASAKGCPAT